MAICIVICAIANRKSTPYGLILSRFNRILLLKRVHVHYVNHLVRPIHEQQLLASILNIKLGNRGASMLGYFVLKFHLYLPSDFFTFIPHDKFGELLVTHIS